MNSRTPENRIRSALDARLSGVVEKPGSLERVLRQARGERIVKKKLSVGLVLAIVLVLVTLTALAVALLWEQQVVPMKEIEQTQGDYVNWPFSQKQVLIRALINSGNIVETSETTKLFDNATDEATKHSIADGLVLTLTGQSDVKEISVDIITYAIMGPEDRWTPEQRVWWQLVTNQFRDGNGGDPDTLVIPNGEEISEEDAIAIAKAAILKAYNFSGDVLQNALPVANLYVTEQRSDYRRWDVQFKLFREGSDSYVEKVYSAVVDAQGNVIADPDVSEPHVEEAAASAKEREALAAIPKHAILQRYYEYSEEASHYPFRQWPIELKAACSQELRTQVLAVIESGDLTPLVDPAGGGAPYWEIIASTTFAYGLPTADDISQERALDIAKLALQDACGLTASVLNLYSNTAVYFDVTVPGKSKWKFYFNPKSLPFEKLAGGLDDPLMNLCFKVEVDSRTGEVLHLEQFNFQTPGRDMEYTLKLY